MDEGLLILCEVRDAFGCPVITDVHEVSHCAPAAEVVDVIQIPAFLSRQTDLLLAAGNTGKPINVKKGQFLAPWEMHNVAEKIASTGTPKSCCANAAHRSGITHWSMISVGWKPWVKQDIRDF